MFLLFFTTFALVIAATCTNNNWGSVKFERMPSNVEHSLIKSIIDVWQCYLHLNRSCYSGYHNGNVVTRFSQRWGKLQNSRVQIAADLEKEWELLERPNGVIAEKWTITNFRHWNNPSDNTITTIYQAEIVGGARWSYTDQALICQIWSTNGKDYQIDYHTDAFNLDIGGGDTDWLSNFQADFIQPVNSVAHATSFYNQLLGPPLKQDTSKAIYQLPGGSFILDISTLNRYAGVKMEKPNGYIVFYVDDVSVKYETLKQNDYQFVSSGVETTADNDRQVVGLDVSGNVFIIRQRQYSTNSSQLGQLIVDQKGANFSFFTKAVETQQSWVFHNAQSLDNSCGSSCLWFDDSRKNLELINGGSNLAKLLPKYWQEGAIDIHLSDFQQPKSYLINYKRTLTSKSLSHPSVQHQFVTQIFDGNNQSLLTLITAAEQSQYPVVDLDYVGYPVQKLRQAQNFYQNQLNLGTPYSDDDWRGFWGKGYVFGIYTDDDDKKKKRGGGGYMSFWIRSANETYNNLRQQKEVKFPLIPAINDKTGISKEAGYVQVVATDNEGNVVVFTEYTGKKKKT